MDTEKKLIKSGTVKTDEFHFNIRDIPFSRKFSLLYFSEKTAPTEAGSERKQILLSRTLKKYNLKSGIEGPGSIAIRPMHNDMTIPYVCKATPAIMELNTEYGYVQFCFDNQDLIRIRGKGIGLRFYARMKTCEFGIPRLDGTFQLSYDPIGEFLFVPATGSLDFSSKWKWKDIVSDEVVIDAMPDDNGEFELAVHYNESDTERALSYRLFDDCVAEADNDYADWLSMYPNVPGKYEYMKKFSAYAIWICYIAPRGILKGHNIAFSKEESIFSWHQPYHAMAIANNADFAVNLIGDYFNYQDEYGEIADLVDDQYINFLATKPPIHGYALLRMMERMGDRITDRHCEILYEPLTKLYQWWTTLRDTDNDGIPQYNQGCESGIDFTLMLSKGVPVECPDLMAYLILLGEALGRLAERLGKEKEAAEWFNRSKKMLDTLLQDFWNGEKFVCRLSTTHEIVEADEVEVYVPLILGKRLPREVVDRMTKDLADPDKYYTKIGFRSAPKKYSDGKPVLGYLMDFTQIRLIPGLYEAGKKELARDVLTGFCDHNLKEFPCFGYLDPESQGENMFANFGRCSALACGIFLTLAGYLAEISQEA